MEPTATEIGAKVITGAVVPHLYDPLISSVAVAAATDLVAAAAVAAAAAATTTATATATAADRLASSLEVPAPVVGKARYGWLRAPSSRSAPTRLDSQR